MIGGNTLLTRGAKILISAPMPYLASLRTKLHSYPMSNLPQRFFLQAIDPHYGCPVLEAMFIVSDLSELCALIGPGADSDPEVQATYSLEDEDLAALCERYGVAIASEGKEVQLERWHSNRSVPYLVHTNYELFLLLEGKKQFARMGCEYPPSQHENEMLFDNYVAKGMLHKKVEFRPFPHPFTNKFGFRFEGIRDVYYTRSGEEWRIAAWKMLWAASDKAGWNETCECVEGMLFGYEEWQIDWWAKKRHKHFELMTPSAQTS